MNLIDELKITNHDKNLRPINISQGDIEFKDVTFGYSKNKFLFNRISLQIYGGQKIVCVGHSGSGKSTFIDLILRLFTINSGSILIDGPNINDVILDSLRAAISLVPQEPILFNRTIVENIKYGKEDSSMEEVFLLQSELLLMILSSSYLAATILL